MIISTKDGSCLATGTVTKKGGEMLYVGEKKIPKYIFSICLERKKDENGEWQAKYLDCELFGKKAERAPHVIADDMVLCAGKLVKQSWKGKEGEDKSKTVLDCDFVMVSGNAAQNAVQMTIREPQGFQEAEEDFDEDDSGDLPF